MENRDNKDCSEFEKEYIRFLQEEIKNKITLLESIRAERRNLRNLIIAILGGIILGAKVFLIDFNIFGNKNGPIFFSLLLIIVVLATLALLVIYGDIEEGKNDTYNIKNCKEIENKLLENLYNLNNAYKSQVLDFNSMKTFFLYLLLVILVVLGLILVKLSQDTINFLLLFTFIGLFFLFLILTLKENRR